MLTFLAADWAQTHRLSDAWLAVPAISCLLVLGTITHRQVGYWQNTESLWLHTLASTEENYGGQIAFAGYLLSQDRVEEAGAH
jgi:hypothetical protein